MNANNDNQELRFTLWQLLATVTAIAVFLAIMAPWVEWIRTQTDSAVPMPVTVLALVVVVVVPGLVIGLGILPLRSNHTSTATCFHALSHGLGLFGMLGLMLTTVPAFEKVFKDFDLELPYLARVVITASYRNRSLLVHDHSFPDRGDCRRCVGVLPAAQPSVHPGLGQAGIGDRDRRPRRCAVPFDHGLGPSVGHPHAEADGLTGNAVKIMTLEYKHEAQASESWNTSTKRKRVSPGIQARSASK